MLDGKRITKLEWDDPSIYCLVADGFLRIHIGGKENAWSISEADMEGTDWIVLEEVN